MIESIFIARGKTEPQVEVAEIELVAGKGIVGDRNFSREQWPGQNVTFIELEEIENFNANYGRAIGAGDTRRNIVTRSVRLDALVGRDFRIGEVVFHGVELCEPCKTLGSLLASDGMAVHEVVRAWVHKAGLRANVLTGGVIRVGMRFTGGAQAQDRML
ncbi:MOSC domain-containing protein [Solimonas terrae]|uniref:MOSC domain-containing protein n=1 Tax=Solimonas terrae TaxID=1396819 RepID=A0A6M2BKV6_9GAMM|nr:MOSC domain-containing protein [Solimonas terrae]NGY03168.1 MOSC domain-containing protein [Solimonas terrae]